MNNIIKIKNLKKNYGDKQVLKGVDLEITEGQIFCLLGSNGAGKTTMIKILTTLIKKDSGNVVIGGLELDKNNNDIRKIISVTGQYATVDEMLTAYENMMLISSLYGIKDKKGKSNSLLKQFNLFDVKDKRVSEFSGGMRRRLDIAMSLIGDPKIIFLDEPTTGLDPQSRIALWKKIKDLRNSGVTIFLTTQYLDEAENLAEQIAILNNGRIIAKGTSAEIKNMVKVNNLILEFGSSDELESAESLLSKYTFEKEPEFNRLIIELEEDLGLIIDILTKIKDAGLHIVFMEQRKPTLEEVFLEVIGRGEHHE